MKETQYLLEAIGIRDCMNRLTYGKQYETLHGIEKGHSEPDCSYVFPDYVTVLDNRGNGKITSCHLSRFKIIKEID